MRVNKFLGFLCIAAALTGWACQNPATSGPATASVDTTSLTVRLTETVSRLLVPQLDMNVAKYRIDGVGPGGATFSQTFAASNALTVSKLAFGTWAVSVTALNAQGVGIGSAWGQATIHSNQTTSIDLTVVPYSGFGTLALAVRWPAADVESASIDAKLYSSGAAVRDLNFAIVGNEASWSDTHLATGYHTLALKLLDNGALTAGAVEVVRIVKDQTTSGNFRFDKINKAKGSLDVGLTLEMDDPLTLNIAGASPTKTVSQTLSLTASVVEAGVSPVYLWWVNGEAKGVGPQFDFDSSWDEGHYRIDVTAYSADGKRAASATANVEVTEADLFQIRANQVEYYPGAAKEIAVVNDTKYSSFSVLDENDVVVYTRALVDKGYWSDSGDSVKLGDFTAFQTPGSYKIKVGSIVTGTFTIGASVLKNLSKDLTKFYYYQRASTPILATYAGVYSRPAGHPDVSLPLHSTTGQVGTRSVAGGWYDAGDYGKYVVNAGITVATLLGLYEAFGDVTGDGLGIPESGNGRSDLLDEVRYELDWFKTMQDVDGGVFFKVASLTWNDGWTMPNQDPNPRYVIGKSTTSTLNFAAVMAQASRLYASSDPVYAADCLERARSAWAWAIAHPAVSNPEADNANGGSGAYGDGSYADEFFWAASELFASTQEAEFQSYVDAGLNAAISDPGYWGNVRNWGLYSLSVSAPPSYRQAARSSILAFADTVVLRISGHPFAIPTVTGDFVWGSNSGLANYAVALSYAYAASNDARYLKGISSIANYLLGKNATGYSFVTGYGSQRALNPHHRISANDAIADPIPGMVIGGPNVGQEDNHPGYTSKAYPAKSYLDVTGSYSTNEVAINWNAPTAFLFWVLEKNKDRF